MQPSEELCGWAVSKVSVGDPPTTKEQVPLHRNSGVGAELNTETYTSADIATIAQIPRGWEIRAGTQ